MTAVRCPECRLSYSDEWPADRRFHRKVHDEAVHGMPGPIRRGDQVIWSNDSSYMTVVRHRTATNRQKMLAERVAQWAREDTEFDYAAYHASDPVDGRDAHVFLMHASDRIVGLLVAERRDFTQKFSWAQWDQLNVARTQSPLTKGNQMWSVGMIWVHARHRRKGVATLLFHEAARFFRLGLPQLGWYTPFTVASEPLARKLCPAYFYVAK